MDILSLFCANDWLKLVGGKKLKNDKANTNKMIDFGEWDIVVI
jgi:hypothetical protein